MHSISQIHALMAEKSIRWFYNLLAFGVFHALREDFKGIGWGGKFGFATKATYLYGNDSPTAVRNFGEMVPLNVCILQMLELFRFINIPHDPMIICFLL